MNVIPINGFAHGQHGLYKLKNLPQRPSVSALALDSGWWELDQIFRFYVGQFTVVTGLPGHGKSTFVLNLLVQLAKKHGTRAYLYVPENEQHLLDKLSRIWGDAPGFDAFADQLLIQTAVAVDYEDPAQTLRWVLDRAVVAVDKGEVDIILIDPWNELDWAKPKDQLETEYISDCLKLLKYFARIKSVAIVVVTHPTKPRVSGQGPPTLADISGSMHFYNKCDNGLIVSRKDKETKIISAKVREKGAGKEGACYFTVDDDTEIFTPQYGAVT